MSLNHKHIISIVLILWLCFASYLSANEYTLAPASQIQELEAYLVEQMGRQPHELNDVLAKTRIAMFKQQVLPLIQNLATKGIIPNEETLIQNLYAQFAKSILLEEYPNFSNFLGEVYKIFTTSGTDFTPGTKYHISRLFFKNLRPFTEKETWSGARFSFFVPQDNGTNTLITIEGLSWSHNDYDNFFEISGEKGRLLYLQTSSDTTPANQISHTSYLGEMVGILDIYSLLDGIVIYNLFFPDELEAIRIAKEGIGLVLRNIGRKGILTLFQNREHATLNSPPDGFPVTAVTKNYEWAASADFPGVKGTLAAYGDHVFVIFPESNTKFQPMIRGQERVQGSYRSYDAKEYQTSDPIRFENTLLVRSKAEYEKILRSNAKNRTEALNALGISEAEQAIYENLVYENSLIKEGRTNTPESLEGIVVNELYVQLLIDRMMSPFDQGMLFFMTKNPSLTQIFWTSDTNNWKDSDQMQQDANGNWYFVLDQNRHPQQLGSTMNFKFHVADGSQNTAWQTGIYRYEGPFNNSYLPITGQEVLHSRESTQKRLLAILTHPQYSKFRALIPRELDHLLGEVPEEAMSVAA